MEAAGVEPASERPVAAGDYMLCRPSKFAPAIKERRKWRALVQYVSLQRVGRASEPAV